MKVKVVCVLQELLYILSKFVSPLLTRSEDVTQEPTPMMMNTMATWFKGKGKYKGKGKKFGMKSKKNQEEIKKNQTKMCQSSTLLIKCTNQGVKLFY